VAFICGLSLSAFFMVAIWSKWEENPIIVSLDTSAAIIDDIPFPAVTICNMNKMKRSGVERLTLRSVCFCRRRLINKSTQLFTRPMTATLH